MIQHTISLAGTNIHYAELGGSGPPLSPPQCQQEGRRTPNID